MKRILYTDAVNEMRRVREDLGISTRDFAKELTDYFKKDPANKSVHITHIYLEDIEAGRRNIPKCIFDKIALHLGLDFTYEDIEFPAPVRTALPGVVSIHPFEKK